MFPLHKRYLNVVPGAHARHTGVRLRLPARRGRRPILLDALKSMAPNLTINPIDIALRKWVHDDAV